MSLLNFLLLTACCLSAGSTGLTPSQPSGRAVNEGSDERGEDEIDNRQADEERGGEFPGEELEDEEGDDVVNVERDLQQARRSRDRHAQQLKLAETRIRILSELKKLTGIARKLAEQVEAAEETGDEDVLEELEPELGAAEFRIEQLYVRNERLDRRIDLVDLAAEIPDSDRQRQAEIEVLTGLLDEGEVLTRRLFGAIESDRDDEVEELQELIEQLEESYERKRELLQLRVELQNARREGEVEWVEELEAELKELGEFEKALDRVEHESVEVQFEPPMVLTRKEIDAAAQTSFELTIVPLLKKSCGGCHSDESASGDLNIDALVGQQPLVINRERWKNVIQQLKIRSMPPADADPVPEEDRALLAAWLTHAIDDFDYESIRQPGFEAARRLTHAEYNNTVRDLLGVDVRPADRFPADMTASSGFENSANSLFMQPVLLERYLGAAELIVDRALPLDGAESPTSGWPALLKGADLSESRERRDVLQRFLTRAFRRQADIAEVDSFEQLVDDSMAEGGNPKNAIREAVRIALVSPSFLMKVETETKPGESQQISDWELASRLSFFLWASMPDERLFELAARGTLHEPDVLRAEVRRMLQNPRSSTLGSEFAAQWLGFDGMDRLPRSPIDNPWQTDSLIKSMKQESATLFHHLVSNNLAVDRLVDADFTFVNEELARHYGISGIRGEELRLISLRDSPRRGVLGHGSVLAVTSFPGRTSPVVRGNWILSQLLGTPPPPPPPNVSELDERVAENRRLTARQKLELHRSNPNCYTCHSQIDPLGFALESFEWFGRHRPRQKADVSGQFPGGQPFQGLRGLASTLVSERIDDLSEQVTRKMLAYALGRQLEYFDEATVRDVIRAFQSDGRRMHALIHAIVNSDAFQKKQAPTKLTSD